MAQNGFNAFPNYITQINEKIYKDIHTYLEILDASARLTNNCNYLIDFYRGEVLYMSYNPLFLCGVEASDIKLLGSTFNKKFVSEKENKMITELIGTWLYFIEKQPIKDRKLFTIRYDYYLGKKLINVSMTPAFLCENGKPWIVICNAKLSTHSHSGNGVIYKYNSPQIWEYSFISKKWKENEIVTLTEMEQQIIRFSIQGKKEDDICKLIFRSKDGLKSIKKKMFYKMDVQNITEAVSFALSHGLV